MTFAWNEGKRQEQRTPRFFLFLHSCFTKQGKNNSIYKLQLHSLLSMSSMLSVNGMNSSHNQWSMGYASFHSHVTTRTRDLPMTQASFQHSRYTRSLNLFYSWSLHIVTLKVAVLSFIQEPRLPGVFFVLVMHRESNTLLLSLGMLTRKVYSIVYSLSYSVIIVGWSYWMGVMADTRHWYQARKPCMASWVRAIYSPQSKHCPLTRLSIIQ